MGGGVESRIERGAIADPSEADDYTTSQYYDLRRPSLPADPEAAGAIRLMMAILETSIEDFLGPYVSNGETVAGEFISELPRRRKALARSAEKWIVARGGTAPFSFEKLCEALEFDAEWLRNGLLAKQAQLKARGADREEI
ncbi:MAG TPA: hypothetical protein VMV27_02080 [Candidatus Binataceae bacterium]|nr:hypothetical protein [Candidatus Binataceae bacterium]